MNRISSYKSLTEGIEYNNKYSDKGIYFINGENKDSFLSYKELYFKALGILGSLQKKGIKPGDELVFQIQDNRSFLLNFWACILGGIIPVPVTLATNNDYNLKLFKIWSILNNPYLITNDKILNNIKSFAEKNSITLIEELIGKTLLIDDLISSSESGEIVNSKLNDIAFIQFSSGSTGDPKGVVLTHENLLTNINAIIECAKIEEGDISLSWMPLTHDMGLICLHLVMCIANVNQCIMPTSLFIQKPILWMRKVIEYKISITASPNFGYKYFLKHFNHELAKDWDLSSLRLIVNGAEPISPNICDEFLNKMRNYGLKRSSMFTVYGMAEATVAVSAPLLGEEFKKISIERESMGIGKTIKECLNEKNNSIDFIDLGYPVQNCFFRVCDINNNLLEENTVGYIQISGKNVTKGYYNNIEATQQVISDGWLNTGDLGFTRNGRIVVTGRSKDIIFINGQNYYPHDIERVAEETEIIELGSVACCGVHNKDYQNEEVVLFVVFRKKIEDFLSIVNKLKEHINRQTGVVISEVVPVKKIPKTTSGKLQRYKLIEMYQNGDFTLITNQIDNLLKKESNEREHNDYKNERELALVNIFTEVTGNEAIDINDDYYSLGLQSISMLEIVTKINQKFNMNISVNDFVKLTTVSELAEFINCSNQKKSYVVVYNKKEGDLKNINVPFHLTEVQMAYLLGRNEQYEMGGISTHFYIEIETELEIKKLENSLRKLIERHPMLKAVILPNGEQRILENVPKYKIKIENISDIDSCMQSELIIKERERMAHYTFITDCWPLFEFKAFKISKNKHMLLIGIDMLIADGASILTFGKELMDLYYNPQMILAELNFSFRDYVLACNELRNSETYENDKKYWLDKIKDFPLAPALLLKKQPKDIKKPCFKRLNKIFCKNISEQLKKKAQDKNITLSALLCTAYAEVLAYWSNQPDLSINLTTFNRYPFNPSINNIIGDFTSVTLLQIYLKKYDSFWDNASNLQSTLFEALDHRHYDGIELIREISKNSNQGSKVIMPIVFTSMLFDNLNNRWNDIGEIKMSISQTSQVFLDNQVMEIEGCLNINWDYVEELFDSEVISCMFEQYVNKLIDLCKDNEDNDFAHEKMQLIDNYNQSYEDIELSTLHKIFIDQVNKTPNNIAVIFENDNITYSDLNKKSDEVAYVLQERGIGRNDFIAVKANRQISTLINILGILKTGAAYVPIDPEFPKERQEYIFLNSNCKLLLDADFYNESVYGLNINKFLGIYDNIDDAAYTIYTSGSTGNPKGVIITHRAVTNTIIDINTKFNVTEKDKIIGVSSLCFDLSVYDIFGALSTGATLVMVRDQRDVSSLIKILENEKITFWNSVPAIMDMLVDNLNYNYVNHHIRTVLLSGDWIPLNLPKKILNYFQKTDIISLGGATEASIWSIYFPIKDIKNEWKSIPYGFPLANQRLYVLNYKMQVCPIGVQGELFIGGVGLAKGYMNDILNTNKSFVNHSKLGRLYKTGDYGILHEDGYIEFLGRKDYQVKIRGYRIEIEEIEKCLMKYKEINNAIVVDKLDSNGMKYLCAYLISNGDLKINELRTYIADKLPAYMIPKSFVEIDEIPLTVNGKIDRKQLLEIGEKIGEEINYIAPRNALEEKMVSIWESVFGIEQIGIYDNFFNLGGDSIKAIQISTKAKQSNINISLTDIYKYMNISDLLQDVNFDNKKVIVPQDEVQGYVKLTPIQRWFFEQNNKYPNYWNFTKMFILKEDADLNQLEKIFIKIIKHHDSLRTVFNFVGEEISQYIKPFLETNFKLEVIDISCIEFVTRKKLIHEYCDRIQNDFDLENGPLFKAVVFDLGEEGRRLMIPVHHLIMDGISWRIIIEDINELYRCDNNLELPLKTTSYKEWAQKLEEYAVSHNIDTNYWEKMKFEENYSVQQESYFKEYKMLRVKLNKKQTKNLVTKANNVYTADINSVLLSSLLVAFTESMCKNELLITIEGHGREELIADIDISRTIGWFTSEYPVFFEKQNDIYTAIKHVKDTLQKVPKKGINFGISKYLNNNQKLNSINPNIGFNYLGEFVQEVDENSLIIETDEDFGSAIHPDNRSIQSMYIYGMIKNGCLELQVAYNLKSYSENSIKDFGLLLKKALIYIAESSENMVANTYNVETITYENQASDPESIHKPFPLTAVQSAYLLGRDSNFTMGGISTHYYAEIETKFELERFNSSLQKVIKRHPMLRAIILQNGYQQILDDVPEYIIEVQDLRNLNEEMRDAYIEEVRLRMSHYIFKPDEWPLFEFKAFRLTDDTNYICMGFDLMIADGGSFHLLAKDINAFYENEEHEIKELNFNFRDYMVAYEKLKNSISYAEDKKFWHNKLEDFPSAPAIPMKVDPSLVKKPHFIRKSQLIQREKWELLKLKARKKNITPSALLCTAYAEVLAHWSNQNNMVIDLTVFNRYPFNQEVMEIVGDFTSIILLDVRFKAENNFWQNAESIQFTIMEGLEHRNYDGVEFIRDVVKYNGLENIAAMPIVFTSMLFEDTNSGLSSFMKSMKYSISQTSQVYLDYQVMEIDGNLYITWDYVDELFDEKIIDIMFKQNIELLLNLNCEEKIANIEIVKKDKSIIEKYNSSLKIIEPSTLQKLFIQQVRRTPDNIAVKFENESLTYRELDIESDHIAYDLCNKGIGRKELVGVIVKRDISTIVNIIGILKSGAAYVPIDPEYPVERQEYIIKNSNCKMILNTNSNKYNDVDNFYTEKTGIYDNVDDVAYIIYTSGSTGRPKGVVITHKAICNTIIDINQKFEVGEKDTIIGLSSMCFDLSVYDIFGALSTGATLVIIQDQRDAKILIEVVERNKITFWNSVPAIMDMFLQNVGADFKNRELRKILLSGDWIPLDLIDRIKNHFPSADIVSLGGATEASIWSIYYPIKEVDKFWKSIPYGMPLANQTFYVLDYKKDLCPVGVPGELYIGGNGLALGYFNDEEKSQSVFITHEYLGKLYKTGDFGILHEEGYIEFLGRKDQQIKIKGYRIELGEIESHLLRLPSITNAVVVDRIDSHNTKYLCAYVVTEEEEIVAKLRTLLMDDLPDYMIPLHFVRVQSIPLTPNGKINRKELPEPDIRVDSQSYIEPRDNIDKMLIKIWSQLLDVKNINIGQNFFELGGDSMLAQKLVNEIETHFHVRVTIRQLFMEPTLINLSNHISHQMNLEEKDDSKIEDTFDDGAKFYWSPLARWKMDGNSVEIEKNFYSGIAVEIFPKFYFLAQDGITLNTLKDEFKDKEIQKLSLLMENFINDGILINKLLTPKDIFSTQSYLFNNQYGEEILYNSDEYNKFKIEKLNRSNKLLNCEEIILECNNFKQDIFEKRRSHRVFDIKKQISIETFSQLLSAFKQNNLDDKIRYNYATAGGLYPIDIYIYVKENRIQNLHGGLYYYNPIKNSINFITGASITEDAHYYKNKEIFKTSAFTVFLIYNAEVNMPIYGSIGYFYACIDAGIMVGLLTQAAENIDIGLCSIGEMNFESIYKYFSLDKNQIFIHAIEGGLIVNHEIENEIDIQEQPLKKLNSEELYYPVSSAQKRLFILQEMYSENMTYNNPNIIKVEGSFNISKIEECINTIIDRHESLRTTFELINGEPVQIIHEKYDFKIEYVEMLEDKVENFVKNFVQPFDLKVLPLLRVCIVKLSENKCLLLMDAHHIIIDKISRDVFIKELVDLYEGKSLPKLSTQYKDYTLLQKQFENSEIIKKQEQYWLETFYGDIPVLNVPTDFKRPDFQSFEGDTVQFMLGKELTTKLKKIASENGVTLYMILLAAYNTLLFKYTGQEDIIIGSPIAGRRHSDLQNMIGMFANTVAIRNHPEGEKTFKDFLYEVRSNALSAYENQDYQFEKLVEKLNIPRDFSRNPLFDTMFTMQNSDNIEIVIDDLSFSTISFGNKTAKFDVSLTANEVNEDIQFELEYCTKLFNKIEKK